MLPVFSGCNSCYIHSLWMIQVWTGEVSFVICVTSVCIRPLASLQWSPGYLLCCTKILKKYSRKLIEIETGVCYTNKEALVTGDENMGEHWKWACGVNITVCFASQQNLPCETDLCVNIWHTQKHLLIVFTVLFTFLRTTLIHRPYRHKNTKQC